MPNFKDDGCLHLALPGRIYTNLKALAENEGLTLNAYCRKLLTQHSNTHRPIAQEVVEVKPKEAPNAIL